MKTEVVPNLNLDDYPEFHKAYAAILPGQEDLVKSLHRLPWLRYQTEYIFIEPTNKAAGIRRMLELLGGDPKEVVVFGERHFHVQQRVDQYRHGKCNSRAQKACRLCDGPQ